MTQGQPRPLPAIVKLWGRRLRTWAILFCAALLATSANAELLEQIDVNAESGEIAIRFSTTVQYERHSPPMSGTLLKIEFQITGTLERADGRLLTELRRHPGNRKMPAFDVTYDSRTGFLSVKFARATAYRVGPGADPRSIRIVIPEAATTSKAAAATGGKLPTKASGKPSTPPGTASAAPLATPSPFPSATTPVETETLANDTLTEAKKALADKQIVPAIDLLNRILNMPPTKAAQDAQELVGEAREANGEFAKARAEYELYLKLYPSTPGAERVTKRVAALANATSNRAAGTATPVKPEYTFYGSLSSYYYSGSTKYDATLAPPQPGLNFDQISLTSTDQSALVTNIDLNGRYRGGAWEHKIVVRDTSTQSFLSSQRSYNRLNSAYVESLNKGLDFFARVGRQSSPGYGVLGRFDGAWLRYGLNAVSKFDLIGGEPVEFYPSPKKTFVGGAIDLGPFADRWSGNVFAIEQRVDGVSDRRAVGSEIRYLDPQKNGFALVDYDPTYKKLNIALIQGNWQIREGTSFNFLYDTRRSPNLQLTNGLSALPFRSIRENLDSGITVDELRSVSKAVSPISTLFSVGLTQQFSPAWQVGGDIKYSEVSGTGATASQMAQAGTGKVFVYGMQAIRTGALTINDIIVATSNIIRGKTYDGELFQLSHVLLLAEKWRVETTLKYYHQVDSLDNTLSRFSPSARLSYRWTERVSFEGEAGAERSTNKGPAQSEKTSRRYYNLGLRYDFF
ncbi:MAG: hypothetical protein ABL931_06730 [Usitatibacteraceae bacterium]